MDLDVLQSGPCISDSMNEILIAPVLAKEVKDAVFSIGDSKASGSTSFLSFIKTEVLETSVPSPTRGASQNSILMQKFSLDRDRAK
ncbi:hypothetical protein L6164_029295 [Bauhinia variegata]|uniref:Uncharacterized protein n=1 Tax=Bauhinia variegata TaxID=167791 RepID=A0ACB9L8C9_BAUVA|nr:hypothetical protein L6164_029295 [Bauhinia variegata]